MSSARLTRILRTAAFRLTLAYAVLFVLSAGALFAAVYWTATAAMQTDMSAVLRTEACSSPRSTAAPACAGLARADHATDELPHSRSDLLSAAGAQSAGSWSAICRACRPSDGVIDLVPQPDTASPTCRHGVKLTGFGLTLPDGSFLLVAPGQPPRVRTCSTPLSGLRLGGRAHPPAGDARRRLAGRQLPAPHRHDQPHQPRHHGRLILRRAFPHAAPTTRSTSSSPTSTPCSTACSADGRPAPGLERHRARSAHAAGPAAPAASRRARPGADDRGV